VTARGLARAALVVGIAAACRKPALEPARPLVVGAPDVAPVPTGRMVDGVYIDGTWPLVVPVPPGWLATVGADGEAERLRLTDPDGDVRVTVAASRGDTLAPRPIEGCAWTFTDVGRYRAVKVRDAVLVGTCTPEDPDAPRVLAYVIARDGVLVHVEGAIPPGRLRAGRADFDRIVGDVRFR